MAESAANIDKPQERDLESEIKTLKSLLEQEVEKGKKAEEKCRCLEQGLDAKLEEKRRELDEKQSAQTALNDNLLDTTVLVERMHEKFAGAVQDLEEGILAKFCEFQKVPDNGPDTKKQLTLQMSILHQLNEVFEKLDESKADIGIAVGELKSIVKDRTTQVHMKDDGYKSIFRRVKDGIFIVDSKWSITDINPAMCEMLGYKYRRFAMDHNLHDDVFADEYDFEVFEKDVILSEFIRNYETKFLTSSGEEIDVIVSCTAIWGEGDVLVGYEGIVRDITEQKKLQRQKVNMQRLEAVNNMVITISHNINQNLTVISNYLQVLKEDFELEPKLGNYIEVIYSEVKKVNELVRKITKIKDIRTTEYVDGVQMLDLEKSIQGE